MGHVYLFWLFAVLSLNGPVIRGIRFEGVKAFNPALLAQVANLRRGSVYRPTLIRGAVHRLEEFYRRKGFFRARVIAEAEPQNGDVRVIFRVSEGLRAQVDSLEVLVAGPPLRRRVFQALSPPFPYDEDLLGKVLQDLIAWGGEHAHPFLEARYRVDTLAPFSLKVTFEVDTGPPVRVRLIRVEGNRSVRLLVITRELLVHPGEPYRTSLIVESLRRIYATGLFSSVRYDLEPVSDSLVDLVFWVRELPPRFVEIGAGYQTPSFFQLRLSAGHINLFNNAQRLEGELRLFASLTSLRRQRLDLRYSEPYLLGFRLEGRAHLFYFADRDQEVQEYGANLQLAKVFTPSLRLLWALGWKRVFGADTAGQVINTWVVQGIQDTRDNVFSPTRGVFLSARMDQAGGVLGGSSDFFRGLLDFSGYRSWGKSVWAFRVRMGVIWPYGRSRSIPLSERFLLGGEGSLRGYDRYSLGPPDPRPNIGGSGTHLINLNLELRYRLRSPWEVALFLDSGDLENRASELRPERFALSWGVGLRYLTPVGPIRLDWGIKLRDRRPGDLGRVYLAIGHMF